MTTERIEVPTGENEEEISQVPSEDTEDVSANESGESEIKIEDTPEFKLEVIRAAAKRAQSMKDKELEPLYKERDGFKKEASLYKAALGDLEITELENLGDDVKDVQKMRREWIRKTRELEEDIDRINRKVDESNTQAEDVNAWLNAMDCVLTPEIRAQIESLHDEFMEYKDNPEAVDLLKKVKASKTSKPAPKQPDKSRATSSGGRTFTTEQIANMSPEEYVKNREAIIAAMEAGKVK